MCDSVPPRHSLSKPDVTAHRRFPNTISIVSIDALLIFHEHVRTYTHLNTGRGTHKSRTYTVDYIWTMNLPIAIQFRLWIFIPD